MVKYRMPGYNEDGSVNEKEAAAIQHIFTKYVEYSDNPPQILIDRVMVEQKRAGNDDITPEEAAALVDGDMIRSLLATEANEICGYPKHEEVTQEQTDNKRIAEASCGITYEKHPERVIQMAAQVGLVVRDGRVVKVEDMCEQATRRMKEE